MDKSERTQTRGAPQAGEPGVFRRWIDKVLKRASAPAEPAADLGQLDALPPAGQRSGTGTESLGPYLEQARNSRPAPLE